MILFPPAKINIGLSVRSKRRDGYHNIETIMLPIGLSDALEVVEARSAAVQASEKAALQQGVIVNFSRSGLTYSVMPSDDLVIRAWQAVSKYVKKQGGDLPPINIHLHKCIPPGAGLGGGSSDAAAMVMLLSDLLINALPEKARRQIASSLGSDCSFFMQQLSSARAKPSIKTTAMLATGRGNIVKPIHIPALTGKYLVLVCPPIHVATSEAYSNIQPSKAAGSLAEAARHPIKQWPDLLVNDFETNAMQIHPTIGEIKNKLYDLGACYASMSGTGSAVYGLFETPPVMATTTFPDSFTWSQHL